MGVNVSQPTTQAVTIKLISAAIFTLLSLSTARAQTPQKAPAPGTASGAATSVLLANAARLYRQGDYGGAGTAYQELLRSRPESPYLHYNLANVHFKGGPEGGLGRAIAEYWKAYRILPRDPDIRHNFDFALKRAGESLVPPGTPRALHLAFYYLSGSELLGLQWIGYWLSLLATSVYLLSVNLRPKLRPLLFSSLAFWAFFGSWWGLRHAAEISDPGVILEPNAEARSGPGMNFPVSFNAPEGRRVSILSTNGNWLEIGVLKEGLKGWVATKSIERI